MPLAPPPACLLAFEDKTRETSYSIFSLTQYSSHPLPRSPFPSGRNPSSSGRRRVPLIPAPPCCREGQGSFDVPPAFSSSSGACWEARRRDNSAVFSKSGRRLPWMISSPSVHAVLRRAVHRARGELTNLRVPLIWSISRGFIVEPCTTVRRRASLIPAKLRRPFRSGATTI